MSNTISPSFYTRSITWLTGQTSPSKANDTNSSAAVKWMAKRTRATNIALGSGALFAGSWILDYFTKDSDNRVLNYFTKGLKWISGIATIAFPFANSGSKKDDALFLSKPLFSADDPELKEKFLRSFMENIDLPVISPIGPNPSNALLPRTSLPKEYREKIYKVILTLAGDSQDPLFLSTSLETVPIKLKLRASSLRTALLEAYGNEITRKEEDPTFYCEEVVRTIESILDLAKEIPRCEWNEDAKKQKELKEQNDVRFLEFSRWSSRSTQPPVSEPELKIAFDQLTQSQKESLHLLNDFYNINDFSSMIDLNKRFKKILEIIDLNSQVDGEKLTQENSEKGLFFFKYLNALMKEKIVVGDQTQYCFKDYLDDENKNYLLRACMSIVHDKERFPTIERDLRFFTNPSLICVPGQALSLHHKLTLCFSNGSYVDLYGLKDFVLDRVVDNISPPPKAHSINGGFLLSGPSGTGKSYFAYVLANQLAVPLVVLKRGETIKTEGESPLVKMLDGREITLGALFSELKSSNGPCVLLMKDVEQFLPPRECDGGYVAGLKLPEGKNELTDFFLSNLQNIRDEKGASKVIVIMTTDYPNTKNIKIDLIDEHGRSPEAENELHKYVSSAAIRSRRIDYKIFSFHKPYDAQQGEVLARHFLEPYIHSEKIEPIKDLTIKEIIKDFTPYEFKEAIISIINTVTATNNKISEQELLSELRRIKESRIERNRAPE